MRAPLFASAFGAVFLATAHASAQRSAADRFEPSERGSEWVANESLDLRGALRPSVGYVTSYSRKIVDPSLRDASVAHLGASVVVASRLRFALDMPLQAYAAGDGPLAPPREAGIGDLRAGADVRLFGEHRSAITCALGVQAWAPTGMRSQWASDGTFRVRPRLMLAGELGAFVWAAQAGVHVRRDTEMNASAAAGMRIARRVVIGPELLFASAFGERSPTELLVSGTWLVQGTARVGLAAGAGLLDAPAWRAAFLLEWSPEIARARPRKPVGPDGRAPPPPPDADHDGIPDALDACPDKPGVPPTGCPPDSDGDGVDDLADACPTVAGIPTEDPATNGCPDRDRDGDGVPNDVDACPDAKGPPDPDPKRNGCPRAFVRKDDIVLLDPLAFDGGALAKGEPNESVLTAILAAALTLPETTRLRIEGHTDDRGDPAALRKLSAARAESVASWLADHGIARARMTTEGLGPDRPLTTNATEPGRAENRRVEIHIVR